MPPPPSLCHAAPQVVRWQPRVLAMSTASMKLKAVGLASVLGVPPTAVQEMFSKQPLLLNLSAKSLVAKTRALKALLGYSDLQLWQALFTKPGVLLFASDTLASKWESLQKLAGETEGLGCGGWLWWSWCHQPLPLGQTRNLLQTTFVSVHKPLCVCCILLLPLLLPHPRLVLLLLLFVCCCVSHIQVKTLAGRLSCSS